MSFQPSNSQQRAICHRDGPMLVLAGPGSGKTAVITERIGHLITRHGIPPENILVITFTKAAAIQLAQRFAHLTDHRYPQVTVRTFHSLFYRILQHSFGSRLPLIASGQELFSLASELLSQKDPLYASPGVLREFLKAVSQIKSGVYDLENPSLLFSKDEIQVLFGSYERLMSQKKLMDMDDILLMTKDLLRTDVRVRRFWQQTYPYLMIDEFQDISPLQFDCIMYLSGDKKNLFAVGDDDQAIYHFRGARPQLMLDFHDHFPNAGQILLETNYRCPQTVTEAAGRVIEKNKKRYRKQIVAAKKGGEPVILKQFPTVAEEASYVACCAKQHITENPAGQFAVLFRNNRQASAVIGQLVMQKIPYRLKERTKDSFGHWIIQDMMAYIHIARDCFSPQEFFAVMNKPERFLSRETVAEAMVSFKTPISIDILERRLCAHPQILGTIRQWRQHNRLLGGLPPYGAVAYIRKVMGYDGFLKKYADKTGTDLQEYTDILEEFASVLTPMKSWEDYQSFLKDKKRMEKSEHTKEEQAVVLSTMHGAKGLEFDHVCVLDVNEGITPYGRHGVIENIEEERRLFYVAMTRAKKKLQLLFVKNEEQKLQPSRFLKEAFPDMDSRVSC